VSEKKVAAIVIGRNEGERLKNAIISIRDQVHLQIYVDSGSTDSSVVVAADLGVHIVELDMSIPFTAARARNAGFEKLQSLEGSDHFTYVQFVDGDCKLDDGWITVATRFLDDHPSVAAVRGILSEQFPERTRYNQMCNMEWGSSVGEIAACGGIAMMRRSAFEEVGGFDPSIIAGEEPELCYRLRRKGWKIFSVGEKMALHDANITRFSQWWDRSVRSGHAYAEGHARAGHLFTGFCAKDVWSIVFWALFVPVLGVTSAVWTQGAGLLLFAGYGVLWWRIRSSRLDRGDSTKNAVLYTNYCILGKFAQLLGVLKFWNNRLAGRYSNIIEYKGP